MQGPSREIRISSALGPKWLVAGGTLALCSAALLVAAPPLSAQRTLAQDTLSEGTPVAASCGFCEGDRFGVVFRELAAPERGLEPGDFPLTLRRLQVGVAAVTVSGGVCGGLDSAAPVEAIVEIYAGTTPPTGAIAALPADAPWPGETLVFASDAVPLAPSVTTTAGGSMFELTLTTFDLLDEMSMPIVVEAPNRYLRAVVHIPGGGTSSECDGLSRNGPGAVPVRDDDGRIAPERGFIYDPSAGWLWNESAGVAGDWGIRLVIQPSVPPGTDGGPSTLDAATPDRDAGAATSDASSTLDAGAGPTEAATCACRATRGAPSPRLFAGAIGLLMLFSVRRRAGPRERRRGAA